MQRASVRAERPPGTMIVLGVLWLVLAGALLAYRFMNPASVTIEWDTATEVNTAGFALYRSQMPDEGFQAISQELIPSKGDPVTGNTYRFVDKSVRPGETYYYVLEEVEMDASRNRFDNEIFAYTVPTNWWLIVLSAVSVVAGLALIVTGVREGGR